MRIRILLCVLCFFSSLQLIYAAVDSETMASGLTSFGRSVYATAAHHTAAVKHAVLSSNYFNSNPKTVVCDTVSAAVALLLLL